MAPHKFQLGYRISFLGADVRCAWEAEGFVIVVAVLATRRVALADELVRAEQHGLLPGQAGKLRGKLGFAQTQLFGRFGRVSLAALAERLCARGAPRALCPALQAVVAWWRQLLNPVSYTHLTLPTICSV